MKRGRTLMALLLVLALLCVGVLAAVRLNPDNQPAQEEEEGQAVSLFRLEEDRTSGLAWTRDGQTIALTKGAEGWSYAADAALPLDGEVVQTLLSALSDVTAERTIQSPAEPAQYGLDQPALVVEVTGEKPVRIQVGNLSSAGDLRYVALEGDPNVYMTGADIDTPFQLELYDLVQEETVPSLSDIRTLTLETQGQSLNMVRREESGRTYSDSYVWFLEQGTQWQALDNEGVRALTDALAGVEWIRCVSYHADAAALAGYGLDRPAAVAAVEYADGTFVLEVGSCSDAGCYVRIAGSSMVYLADAGLYELLVNTTADALRPDEVIALNWDKVTAIDILLDGETVRAERVTRTASGDDAGKGEQKVWVIGDAEVSLSAMLSALTGMTGDTDVDAAAAGGRKVGFVFHRDTDAFARVEVGIYEYDSSTCLATLDGESRVLISNADVDNLVEQVRSLIQSTVKTEG